MVKFFISVKLLTDALWLKLLFFNLNLTIQVQKSAVHICCNSCYHFIYSSVFCIYFIKIKAFPLIIFALSSQYSCFQKINLLEFSTDCKSQLLNIERKQKGKILLYETNNTDIAHFFYRFFRLDAPFRTRICCRIKPHQLCR